MSVSAQARTPSVLATDAGAGAGAGHDITDVAGQVQRLAEAHRILQQIDERAGLAPAAAPLDPTRVAPTQVAQTQVSPSAR